METDLARRLAELAPKPTRRFDTAGSWALARRRRRRQRTALVTCTVALIGVVTLSLLWARVPERTQAPANPPTEQPCPPELEGCPFDEARQERFRGYLSEYDQAEIDHLYATADPNLGEISPELMVSMLEYRMTCRALNDALANALSASADERAVVVDRIMGPRLARMAERTRGDSPEWFGALADSLIAGDVDRVQQFVEGDCYRSIHWADNLPPD